MKKINIKKNTIIVAIVLIALIIGGALAATTFLKPQEQVTATPSESTKLTFHNNGTTWVHLNIVLENVTLKNGSTQTFYIGAFLKPNGTAVIDLSNLAGYGTQKLPAGTSMRMLIWGGLFQPQAGSTGDLNIDIQGWSGLQPTSGDAKYNVFLRGVPVFKLPASVTDDTITIKTSAADLYPEITTDQRPVFQEEIVTVNQNGQVTITIVQAPELCRLMAQI